MKKMNIYQKILESISCSILLTFVFTVTEVINPEFIYILQSFAILFLLHFVYYLFIHTFLKEKLYKKIRLTRKRSAELLKEEKILKSE